ncbi:MAG: hypothetical protein HY242_09100 [Afipia sp.]|nr:hypothetical protein [Afipia sp.]
MKSATQPPAEGLARIFALDGSGSHRDLPFNEAHHEVSMKRDRWTFEKPPAPGWDRETPRYRVSSAEPIGPALRAIDKGMQPYSFYAERYWQYGDRVVEPGEEVATTMWPHLAFQPINDAAREIVKYFTSYTRSRMGTSPWKDGKVYLPRSM